jgi:Domain of unknown function (DUF4157)
MMPDFATRETRSAEPAPRPVRVPPPAVAAPVADTMTRALGNTGVQGLLARVTDRGAGTAAPDREAEADRVADRVAERDGPTQGPTRPTVARRDGPLSARERAFFEPRLGHDLSGVRLHADDAAAEVAGVFDAEALAVGNDVYFGAGSRTAPVTCGDRLLGHELAHVVQQSRSGQAIAAKLRITGSAMNVARAIALLNSGLRGYRVATNASGEVSITENMVELPPDPQQQALADRLTKVVNDPHDVHMTVSAGSGKTIGGNYATGDFDVADLEVYGVPGLIHEIEEQYQKQVNGLSFGSETTGAHKEAIAAESEVRGARRGAQRVVSSSVNADGTRDAVVEIPHIYPDGTTKTMVMTITRSNIVSVTWK